MLRLETLECNHVLTPIILLLMTSAGNLCLYGFVRGSVILTNLVSRYKQGNNFNRFIRFYIHFHKFSQSQLNTEDCKLVVRLQMYE